MADHAGHDRVVVAAAADRGGRLDDIRVACVDCLALLGDLRALAAATPTSAIPRRPHDYRLTLADAARLRRRGWHRIVAALDGGRAAVSRPLALGLTTLGLVGMLLGSVPAGMPFAAGTARDQAEVAQPAAQPEATDSSAIVTTTGQPAGDRSPGAVRVQGDAAAAAHGAGGTALRILSLAFLAAGVGAFVIRRVASSRRVVR